MFEAVVVGGYGVNVEVTVVAPKFEKWVLSSPEF